MLQLLFALSFSPDFMYIYTFLPFSQVKILLSPKYMMITFKIQMDNNSFSSVAQSCPTLCDPMNRSTPGLPVYHELLEFTQTHVHQVGDAIQPSHPLSSPSLLLPSIPPSIRVFSNESTFDMRWPKYWSFSFSTFPSKEHPGLISFRMDWLDLLMDAGNSKKCTVR